MGDGSLIGSIIDKTSQELTEGLKTAVKQVKPTIQNASNQIATPNFTPEQMQKQEEQKLKDQKEIEQKRMELHQIAQGLGRPNPAEQEKIQQEQQQKLAEQQEKAEKQKEALSQPVSLPGAKPTNNIAVTNAETKRERKQGKM